MTSYFYPHFREREVARARAGWLVAHPDLALQGRYSPARARAGQHSKSLPAYIMQSVGPNTPAAAAAAANVADLLYRSGRAWVVLSHAHGRAGSAGLREKYQRHMRPHLKPMYVVLSVGMYFREGRLYLAFSSRKWQTTQGTDSLLGQCTVLILIPQ